MVHAGLYRESKAWLAGAEWLEMPLTYMDVTPATRLVLTVWDTLGPGKVCLRLPRQAWSRQRFDMVPVHNVFFLSLCLSLSLSLSVSLYLSLSLSIFLSLSLYLSLSLRLSVSLSLSPSVSLCLSLYLSLSLRLSVFPCLSVSLYLSLSPD